MSPVRICFLGTPEFAAQHLQSVLENPKFVVVGVVSQPDRPAGRKMLLTASAVKELALKNKLPIVTPENLRKDQGAQQIINSWNADVAVVVAFGQILSQEFLDGFKFGAVNIHGSLLPRWRGAAPIQRSIEAGDTETGVSLQRIVKKLDAGPIIGERKILLDKTINAKELYFKLANLGCELLNQELVLYIEGKLKPRAQDETKVTIAAKIEKEEALLNWNLSAEKIHNKVRAFSMGPGTYVLFQGKRLKVHKTKLIDTKVESIDVGTICNVTSSELWIKTSEGVIALLEVQPESKTKMNILDFLKSVGLKKGELFV